jgi:hypothetical protein
VALQSEIERQQTAVAGLEATASQQDEALGGLRVRIATLQDETLPSLERQADRSLAEARSFLEDEGAGDLLEDAGIEYERRRLRQSVEVVRANATRYEGDYCARPSRAIA